MVLANPREADSFGVAEATAPALSAEHGAPVGHEMRATESQEGTMYEVSERRPVGPRSGSGRRRRVLAVLAGASAGLAMTLLQPGTAGAAELGDAEKSIVYVGITWEGYVEYPTADGGLVWSDKVTAQSSCTGWFASEQGHIVTAGHCVDPQRGRTNVLRTFLTEYEAMDLLPEATTYWKVEGETQGSDPVRSVAVVQPSGVDGAVIDSPLTVQVVDHLSFDDGDLALLKANSLAEATPALAAAAESAAIGEPVTAIGFPGTVGAVVDGARIRASFKSGTVSSSQVSDSGVARTEINADISPGMSGGPTVNADGEVIGVNSSVINGEEQSFNFITDGAGLQSFLQQHDVQLATSLAAAPGAEPAAPKGSLTPLDAPARPAGQSGLPVWALVTAGIAVVLLANIGLLAALRRRRGAPLPAGSAVSAAAPTTHAATQACGHANNPPSARFCHDCGSRLPVSGQVGAATAGWGPPGTGRQ